MQKLKEGYYLLENLKGKEKPVVAYGYYNKDAAAYGFGFNIADGGGFLELSDLTADTIVYPVAILKVELHEKLCNDLEASYIKGREAEKKRTRIIRIIIKSPAS